jgi:hypothetical protein
MVDTKLTGDIAEAKSIAMFLNSGYEVLEPFGDRLCYDFAIDVDRNFYKIQVKNGKYENGCIKAKLSRSTRVNGNVESKYYTSDEVDYFSIYSNEKDKVYTIPFDEAPKTMLTLRVDDTGNGQSVGVNWAEDYENTKKFV